MVPKMANRERELGITSGIRKYPSDRDDDLKNAHVWLNAKQKDDGVYPFWRVHDGLYDLTDFASRHPGGKFWVESTQGTDITELFESSHIGEAAPNLLKRFFVKKIVSPRMSPFTFEENGFYKTLKRRVTPILKEVGTGPSREMVLIQDLLLVGFISFGVLGALWNSVFLAVVSGLLLGLMMGTAHNFFHQKDNWRMHAFDLSMASSEEWRISHALSHHPYPNTIQDYEIIMFEPYLQLLPKPSKSFGQRNLFLGSLVLIYVIGFFFDGARKLVLVARGRSRFLPRDLLPLVELVVLGVVSPTVFVGVRTWGVIQCTASALFSFVGLMAAHQHPDIYHEGDAPPKDKDWGLHQVVTTRERGELFVSSVFLVAVSFGNHTLHHLFPTVDHSKLPFLMEPFLKTCDEFGVKFEIYTPWKLWIGFYRQLHSTTPNKNYPSILK